MGLDFLARLIHQRYKTDVEFYTIEAKDVMKLHFGDVDFLFISFVGSQSALSYAKTVKYKKPRVFTAIGGPAMLFPAVFRGMADAIMIGRGEDCIFKLIEGDYSGMMLSDSTLNNDSVEIFRTSCISPGQDTVGCRFRCGFCSYSWLHTYASSRNKEEIGHEFTSNRESSKRAPDIETMLKDIHFNMLTTSPFKRPIMGLDILTKADMILTRKPVSFALLRSVIRRLGREAFNDYSFQGFYNARLFTVCAYPWNDPVCDFTELENAMNEGEFPDGVIVKFEISLNHFIPQITTPLECCAVNMNSIRDYVRTYTEPRWKSNGACFHIEKMTAPSPMQAVQQVILQRSSSPDVVEKINSTNDYRELACMFPDCVGWQHSKPAPWIKRNNDASERVERFYDDLYRITPLRPERPEGYERFDSNEDLYNVPVASFEQVKQKKTRGVSKRTFEML